ncbi:carboxypeptidase regulatory-like domain-containing protein [Flammeovirga sp. SJP92]|uniref:FEKKY domain-containing protein n=1 Tax=Flammeovirga sp. SJP92 TaxID=1775430 RepID=UPI000786A7DE|nr:carboxypeptidase regulatory-like domain-containing protein [Flammeovirga sp. SJP92]KXX66877.1 hypothetical protein AVL50_30575 [Flammeovirga sp. SJP92]
MKTYKLPFFGKFELTPLIEYYAIITQDNQRRISLTVLFLIAFVLPCNLSFAQGELHGYVKSSLTGLKPISSVYIEIVNLDKPIKERITMVDSAGFYQFTNLEIGKIYSLKLSAFGYGKPQFDIKINSEVTVANLTLEANCDYSQEQADIDWKKNKTKLLLIGSIAPLPNTRADNRFEEKYNLEYYDFGCTPPIDECIKSYNERVFELMDHYYGKKWRKQVRKDVEYLK